jgi:hypothetical protein
MWVCGISFTGWPTAGKLLTAGGTGLPSLFVLYGEAPAVGQLLLPTNEITGSLEVGDADAEDPQAVATAPAASTRAAR